MDQMEFEILLDEYADAEAGVENALAYGGLRESSAVKLRVIAARKALIEYVFGKQE